ncbi:hypothetical protein PHAVU_003G002700 [Phaseolus vulgaris]|uniref:Uncharacterized protein n=1 Tax=Phaseolus vulgaris TaxID=3885 RepID=V7C6Y7_PHAVU|nr:hypothetical protein PHAVU_003G002700g [Phaseolus vulgaris]ESW25045.1 hypothetical protein PHAVU_003G002700g [Phaseolus vulgaris]
MECLLGFASSVSRDLVCAALNQLRYPYYFNNFIKKLEEEEGVLIVTRDSVQKFIVNAERQMRKTSEVVEKWLQDAISDVDNVNKLLKEAKTKKICCFGHCPNWIWRYRVGKKLANKIVYLEKFIEEGRKYVPFERIATLPSGTLDILLEKCMNFESRQSAYEQLLEAVKNKDVSMIGLYGMGGCGKTTLAMEVRKSVEAEHLFDKVLFVPISSIVEVRRIQENIASSLQYTFSPETKVMERAQQLCLRLTQEKKILVILDDVWEKLDFGAIGIPSSEHHKGFKILITTRSEDVCTSMDCQRKIYLPILTDEEAWTLFQNKALISKGTPDTIKHMGRLISNECKGLPVAIAAVASSLKGKVETIWSVALNKLSSSKPIHIEGGLPDPYKCLQLSYDNLDTEEAKSLFLLCSVFPEDFEIPVEILTRCAIGLGVVGEAHSYVEAKSEVIATKIKLVSSCLLLDEKNGGVKMHDIVRDVAHLIAKDEKIIIKCEEKKDVIVEQNSVTYLWCVKFPNDLDCSNLEFLCLKTKLEESDGIFKGMRMLKVLILFNDKVKIRPFSTMSLKTLTNLHCLVISNYELSGFSFVSDMKKLQSLSLNCCSLPSFLELQTDVAITQVTTLKMLGLYLCDIKGKKFEVIKRSPLLEELYIIDIKGEWDANSEDNIEFFNTFSVPQTLQGYEIVLGSHNFDDYIYFQSRPRTLLLNHFHISNEVIKGLAKKATVLFVANIQEGAKNIMPDIFQIEGGGLDELINFHIRNSKEIECLIETSNHLSEVVTPFCKLHTLRMHNMENLRALWHCFQPANGPFENLEELYLSDCPQLTSLFTYVVARCLVQLKTLEITKCDGLKHILADDDKMKKSQGEFTTGHPVQIFQNLQEVKVNGCRELKDIFSTSVVRGLAQLKVLKIKECNMLDQIFGDIDPLASRDKKKELVETVEEGKHPHSYNTSISSTTTMNNSPGTLSSLAILSIKDCPKLGSIFTASIAKTLTSLEKLIIKRCNSLKHIVTHERVNQQKENIVKDGYEFQSDISTFQRLKKLYISECDLLQQNNTQIELLALKVLTLDRIMDNTILDNYHVKCPSLGELSLAIGRCVEFSTINCSTDALKARQEDYIAIKIWNSDFVPPIESVQYLSKQPHGLTLLIMHNIREIELKGFDKVKYLFKWSIASLLMLEILTIEECHGLEHIIDTEDEYGKENLNAIFPNLRELKKLTKVEKPNHKRISLQKLKGLIIKECTELKQIVGCEQESSKNSFTFSNLQRLEIIGCAKLEVIFPKYVLRCLPELIIVKIRKCEELREIIKEDVEDKKWSNLVSPQPCFPKLEALYVGHCHKLKKCTFGSASIDLPNLHLLIISGASELEEFVGCGQGKGDELGKTKLELPRLKLLIFTHLSSLGQETELPNLKNCFIYKCPKLSLISTTTLGELRENFPFEDFINTNLFDVYDFMRCLDEDYDSSEFTSSQEIGNVGNKSIEEGPAKEGDKTKPLSSGVEDISTGGGVATHIESGGMDILAQVSKVVEQDGKMNEGMTGLNLLDEQEEIHISNNNIHISPASADIRARLGAYKHFVDMDDAQIALLVEAITTYPHLWNASEKFSERFQAWRLKILADMLLFLQKESGNCVIPQKEKYFLKLCEEAVEIGFESSWVDEMRQRVMVRDPKLREEIAQRQMDENPKRSSIVEMVQDSQTIEHGDGPNENCKRTSSSVKTQNVNSDFEKGSNLVDKEGEIVVVSNDRIVTARNEEPEKEFVAKVSTSEIPRTTTSLTNSQPVERPSPSYLNIPLRETHSNALVDKQRISEPCWMNQQKPLGEIVSSPKAPQSIIERVDVGETIAKNTNMATSLINSESIDSQLDQIFTLQTKSHPHSEIRRSQTEARTTKESEGHPKIIQDFGANGIMSLFEPVVGGKEGEDNIVGKILVELEKYLKMSLKDIVSSETNNIRLLSVLNFLSNLPFKDVTLSDGLKDVIGIMQQEFPSIICSFKQGFATTEKLAKFEAREKEVAISLGSKISEAKNFYGEAQLKKVVLKEQIIRLKEEIKVCEDALSSLEEEKHKCIAETIRYKMEPENVRKDNSQMVEDQRKVQQKLFEMAYKWSLLCSQYEYNRMVARNSS